MKLFTNKDIRCLFLKVIIILIFSMLSGIILSHIIIQDFKNQMLNHDYKLAGYMIKHGSSPSDVATVFASEKTEQELSSGKTLLWSLGYREDTENLLLPDVKVLSVRYQMIFLLLSGLFGLLVLLSFFQYFKHENNVIDKAITSINVFMGGDRDIRIDSDEEGSLFKLFASINAMATSMNSHIETEKYTKEFLKNTISDIFHQLKTPLAALEMYNEIMQEETNNVETIKKFTYKTGDSLERMEILIQNLLKITKLDAGTVMLNKRAENIYALIQKIILSFETRAEKEQKTIIMNGSKDTTIYWDRDWMTEAIGNIIKNGLDHTKHGGQIEIKWKESPIITEITIEDNGAGIHSEDIHHIFKRFYRSQFSQDKQGIGLGLPLAKSIIEAHNGTIIVDSIPSKGSTFTLDFLKLTNL